ncbi:uncharacterized protein LOC120330213 [Styela clava]|uniref:probable iron/ascorbate oxidoreductase DDB_G0283291 n=1 Tax=Styela clava TaxID=7725 RepID=UPI00193A2712|nr:probable iron/ascorbate oxidoreductase DDB_G0283291 [Styela clava]
MTDRDELTIVDFQNFNPVEHEAPKQSMKAVSEKIYEALSTKGYVCIQNCGIGRSEIANVFENASAFFHLDNDIKLKYRLDQDFVGYVPFDGDMKFRHVVPKGKEALYLTGTGFSSPNINWPSDKYTPEFSKNIKQLGEKLHKLANFMMDILAQEMKLQDQQYFRKLTSRMNQSGNYTMIRINHYPPVDDNQELPQGSCRLVEHTDLTFVTFIFQNTEGGLQMLDRNGEYIDVPFVSNSMLLITGDVIQKCTGGKIRSIKHRVAVSDDSETRKDRISITYSVRPDNEVPVEGIENGWTDLGSSNYRWTAGAKTMGEIIWNEAKWSYGVKST